MATTSSLPDVSASRLFNVQGMVALITGGGSGLGLYAARALDANGAKAVYIVGRREEVLRQAAASARNGSVKVIVGDVTDRASLQDIAAQIKAEEGFLNLVFANAGVIGPGHQKILTEKKAEGQAAPSVEDFSAAMLDLKPEDFTATMHVNITSVFYTAAAFLPLLKAGNEKRNLPQDSQFIVTSSIAGFSRAMAAGFSYSTSKAGATHLVKMLSTYFAQGGYRIRVNAVAPGFYPSEMTDSMISHMDDFPASAEHDNAFAGAKVMPKDRSPSERTGSEEDFAGTILFMASRAGAFLNGETLVTDGGRLAQVPSVY